MIRIQAAPRPIRTGAALLGVAGILALAGCATVADEAEGAIEPDTSATDPATTDAATSDSTTTDSAASDYADGTYTAEGSYQTPGSVEAVTVTVALEDGVITAVDVVGDPVERESQRYQSQFIGGIEEIVVGEPIDEISVSRVAGSSLTSGGFNAAIEEIKSEAAA